MSSFTSNVRTSHLAVAILVLLGAAAAAQQKVEKSNMDLVGYSDLQARSAYQPTIHKQGERWIAYIGHHGGSQLNPLTGKTGRQRHVDRRRHRSEAAEVPRAHSRRAVEARRRRIGRRADGPRVRRQRAAARGQEQGLPAAQLRRIGARDLGRHRSGEAERA